MSDQSPVWSDKTELWSVFFFLFLLEIIILSGSLFEIIIFHLYLLINFVKKFVRT